MLTPWLLRAAGFALLSTSVLTPCLCQAEGISLSPATLALPNAPSSTPEMQQAPTAIPASPQSASQGSRHGSADPATSSAPGSTGQQAPAATSYDLKKAEHQRILGIMPEFQAVNTSGAIVPLTPGQKFHLMFKSSTDPFIFTLAAIVSGIGQAKDSNPGFGQGTKGYLKRFGASYADTFDGNFWGNAVLTVAFKEDPRYFREGSAYSPLHRALYSAGTAIWTRRDNGTMGPNYANVIGNFISGGISNAYYPAADRGLGKTVTGAITVTAEGTIGSELIEFWPDIAHKLFPKRYHQQDGAGATGE